MAGKITSRNRVRLSSSWRQTVHNLIWKAALEGDQKQKGRPLAALICLISRE
jgi:hypothetical protein